MTNLETKNTHQLKAMLKSSYGTGRYYFDYENNPDLFCTSEEIKAVLVNRPHIPNKIERKAKINQMKGLAKK